MSGQSAPSDTLSRLLELSHQLGREERSLAILGEGNTSARLTHATFAVKASGSHLGSLSPLGLTECRTEDLLPLLDRAGVTDREVDAALYAARVDAQARKPSVEALFHAYLLTLPGVNFVGHTHPTMVNGILCSRQARQFARRRVFPDQVVCCGVESVFVPYADPGLELARAIRTAVIDHRQRYDSVPRVILLQNHGIIALGPTAESVLAATLMTAKAAEIFLGAAGLGGPRFLTAAQARRIAGRADEHYRQGVIGLAGPS